MMTFAMLLAGTNLVINVADAIPRFDVAKTCKAAIELVGQGRTVESCVAGEDKARTMPFRWMYIRCESAG